MSSFCVCVCLLCAVWLCAVWLCVLVAFAVCGVVRVIVCARMCIQIRTNSNTHIYITTGLCVTNMIKSELTSLGGDALRSCSNLSHLSASHNALSSLSSFPASALIKLEVLDLSHNNIWNLGRCERALLSVIQVQHNTIVISCCFVTSIKPEYLSPLKVLQKLFLQGNAILTIQDLSPLAKVSSLQTLYLKNIDGSGRNPGFKINFVYL